MITYFIISPLTRLVGTINLKQALLLMKVAGRLTPKHHEKIGEGWHMHTNTVTTLLQVIFSKHQGFGLYLEIAFYQDGYSFQLYFGSLRIS